MCLKSIKLKWQNVVPLSCGVLELLKKNLRGGGMRPGIDRVKGYLSFIIRVPGDFMSWESAQTLPALLIGPFEHVDCLEI